MIRKILSTALIALPLITVVAQQKPDFSGTWKLNVARSEFGALPGPTSRTDVITHKDPSFSNNVTAETAEAKQQYTANYTTDGKEALNKIGPRDVRTTVKWAGRNLVFSSKLFTTVTTSPAKLHGRSLTMARH